MNEISKSTPTKSQKKIALKEAVKLWEEKYGKGEDGRKLSEEIEVKFNGWVPPIEKMDSSTASFPNCQFLSISTNMIDRLNHLNYLKFLRVLSVSRNFLKSFSGIEACAETLEEVWASYNQIEKPSKGLLSCKNLKKVYLGNNWIREWCEVSRFNELPALDELVLVGNPLSDQFMSSGNEFSEWQKEVGKKIINLKKLDGYNLVRATETEEQQQQDQILQN